VSKLLVLVVFQRQETGLDVPAIWSSKETGDSYVSWNCQTCS